MNRLLNIAWVALPPLAVLALILWLLFGCCPHEDFDSARYRDALWDEPQLPTLGLVIPGVHEIDMTEVVKTAKGH